MLYYLSLLRTISMPHIYLVLIVLAYVLLALPPILVIFAAFKIFSPTVIVCRTLYSYTMLSR